MNAGEPPTQEGVFAPAASAATQERPRRDWTALALFLVALGIYVASGPGRIDIIDGQLRYEVANSLLLTGRPVIRDPVLLYFGVPGLHGEIYSAYNAGASVAALPLVALGLLADDRFGELRRFLFSHTSAFFGAALVSLVFCWLRELGLGWRLAVSWSLILAFATYAWPMSTTTFDQVQHAFFLTLSLYLAWRSRREASVLCGAGGGLAAGVLISYQESFAILIPALSIPLWTGLWASDGSDRADTLRARRRLALALFVAGAGIGLGLWFQYNQWRFGEPYIENRFRAGVTHPPLFGSLWVGLPSLLFSPGKSVFLYSPVLLLGLLAWRRFSSRDRPLAWSILVVSGVQLLFSSSLTFFGSDWAWGPRYAMPVLALWILPAALAAARGSEGAMLRRGIVAVGLGVQLLGLAVDQQRFMVARGFKDYFWYDDPWVYFDQSALLARPSEIVALWASESPFPSRFAPGVHRHLTTYCILGEPELRFTSGFVDRFWVFRLPRPWPLWSAMVPAPYRPPVSPAWVALPLGMSLVGLLLLRRAARTSTEWPATTSAPEPGSP